MNDATKKTVHVGLALIVRHPPPPGGQTPRTPDSGESNLEALITKRRPDAVYAGWWEFPGGKVEAGEDSKACAVREAREELGVAARPCTCFPQIIHDYEHATVALDAWVCALQPDSPPARNLEVAEHRWIDVGALPIEGFLPANAGLCARLRAWADDPAHRALV